MLKWARSIGMFITVEVSLAVVNHGLLETLRWPLNESAEIIFEK